MAPKRFSSVVFFLIICLFDGLTYQSQIGGTAAGFANALEEAQECLGEEGEEQTCKSDTLSEKENSSENVTRDDLEGEDEIEEIETNDCKDEHESCDFWASKGECENNPNYMLVSCRVSCDVCDRFSTIPGANTYGEKQEILQNHPNFVQIKNIINETNEYMSKINSDPKYEKVRRQCLNRNSQCAQWVSEGECKANPAYMTLNCAPSCKSCEQLDIDTRCPRDYTLVDVFKSGDLNKMFERIAQDESFNTTVLSRPLEEKDVPQQHEDDDEYFAYFPWVIIIDDFLSQTECDRLKVLGAEEGYKRSTDVGGKKFDGTFDHKESSGRTSYNAWCSNDCLDDPVTVNVMGRIANLTGVPVENSEHLQLLRYQEGQFYKTHHDYIASHQDRNPGPRILTAYLYLNDVDAGGGTNFPQLDITVMPKRGRLLLWPSVLNLDPNLKDYSTTHQALPVEAGEKYGANGWLHLRNFVDSLGNSCV